MPPHPGAAQAAGREPAGFPVVALPGVGHMPAAGEDEKEAARVFYVAATRATQRLVIGVKLDGVGLFGKRIDENARGSSEF